MIFIAIGSNLSGPRSDSPRQNCQLAVEALQDAGLAVTQRSRWYRSAPVPVSSQPWYVNGVVGIETPDVTPEVLMELLLEIEEDFGRLRTAPNAARTLDLDIIDFDGRIQQDPEGVVLPHPRMHERAFVLHPLSDIAPDWVHPVFGLGVFDLIAGLPPGQMLQPIP